MVDFFLYTKPTCPYCINAKNYLDEHNYSYCSVDISNDKELTSEIKELVKEITGSERATVPQIFDLRNIEELYCNSNSDSNFDFTKIDLNNLANDNETRLKLFTKANHVGGFSDLDEYIKNHPSKASSKDNIVQKILKKVLSN